MYKCINKLTIIGSDHLVGIKPLSEPMQEYCNSDIRNKLQWNLKQNSYIFIQEYVFENVVLEIGSFCLSPYRSIGIIRHLTNYPHWNNKGLNWLQW